MSFLRFPDSIGVDGVASKLICVPQTRDTAVSGNQYLIQLPGSIESSFNLLRAINDAPLTEYEEIGSLVEVGEHVLQHAHKVRNSYVDNLMSLKEVWEKAGNKNTPELSAMLRQKRDVAKAEMRVASNIGAKPWVMFDRLTGRDFTSKKLDAKIAAGNYASVEASSFRHSEKITNGIDIFNKTFKALNKVNNIATVVSIAIPVADVYRSTTVSEENAALERLFKASGAAGAGAVGSGVGAALCTVFGLSTAGFGFLSCGVLIGGLGYLGGTLGETGGEVAFARFGPSSMRIIKDLKKGPVKQNLGP